MSFVFFNPNPKQKLVGDCVIRGISKLSGKSWDTVYSEIVATGYEDKDMPSSNAVWNHYLNNNGYRMTLLPDNCPSCYTVRDFCSDNKRGKFLLAIGDHVVAVEDGNYYDTWDSGNEIPLFYWRKEH